MEQLRNSINKRIKKNFSEVDIKATVKPGILADTANAGGDDKQKVHAGGKRGGGGTNCFDLAIAKERSQSGNLSSVSRLSSIFESEVIIIHFVLKI